MKRRTALWAVAVVIIFIVLLVLPAKRYQPPKARAQRITTVNSVRTVSITLANTNTLPAPQKIPAKQ